MLKPGRATLEWEQMDTAEQPLPDEIVWEEDAPPPPQAEGAHQPQHPRPSGRLARVVRAPRLWATIGLALALTLIWLWSYVWQAEEALRTELEVVMQQGLTAIEGGNADRYRAILDQEAPLLWRQLQQRWYDSLQGENRPHMTVQVKQARLYGVYAEAQVIYTVSEGQEPLTPGSQIQGTHFFRQVGTGGEWHLTAPTALDWGPTHTTETQLFRFVYHAREAHLLAPILADVDQVYRRFRQDRGLPPTPPSGAQARVEIAFIPSLFEVTVQKNGERWEVLAPTLYQSWWDGSTSEVVRLKQRLIELMARLMQDEINTGGARRPDTPSLYYILEPWEMAQWSQDGFWWAETFRLQLARAQREGVDLEPGSRVSEQDMAHYARDFFLIDYVAQTYGRDALPQILRLGSTESWRNTVPSALGVSYDHFLAGWEAYIATLVAE